MTSSEISVVLDAVRIIMTTAEWAGDGGTDNTGWGECPLCYKADWEGHKKDCDFPKVLADFDKVRKELKEK